MSFLPAWGSQHSRLEVTADHRVVNVTPEGAQQQVAEWWPKKSFFNSMETQNLKRLIALFCFRVQEDKVLSTPATRDCVFP